MAELINCPSCGGLFIKNNLRDVCDKCFKEEEKMYETVYQFLRRRENRAASIERVVEVTGVKQELIHKWVRKRRIQTAHFPNMGYPCDKCGTIIPKGKLCDKCTNEIESDLKQFEAEQDLKKRQAENRQKTYFSMNDRN